MPIRYTTRRVLLLTTVVAIAIGAFGIIKERRDREASNQRSIEYWDSLREFRENFPPAPEDWATRPRRRTQGD